MRFGTDGVRGAFGSELTVAFAHSLGRSAARVLGGPRVLIGRDTRASGPALHAALAAGARAEGVDVGDVGVLPTPGVAYLSALLGVPGTVVSASHNPFSDNGIKLFAPGGRKLSDDVERAIEAELDGMGVEAEPGDLDLGDPVDVSAYREHLLQSGTQGRHLGGLRVVLDTAHGAASRLAPDVFAALGAEVVVIADQPDGTNINAGCGSTHPGRLQRRVVEEQADLGLAFDGDADRVLAVDAAGELVDGDQVIAVCALDRWSRGLLVDATVVVTVMTNLGFRHAMGAAGIRVVETKVGDRHVLQALEDGGWSLGGEQSGHIIFRDLATTGDGILTGLAVADAVHRSGRPLADLAAAMTRLPQVLRNVPVAHRRSDVTELVGAEVTEAERELGSDGRVLIRPSGTEPLVRVMVEAPTERLASEIANRLVRAVEQACD